MVTKKYFSPTTLLGVTNVFRALSQMDDGFRGYVNKERFAEVLIKNRVVSVDLITKLWERCIELQTKLKKDDAASYIIINSHTVRKVNESYLLLRELDPIWFIDNIAILRALSAITMNDMATKEDLSAWMTSRGWSLEVRREIIAEVVKDRHIVEADDLMRSDVFLSLARGTIFSNFLTGVSLDHFGTLQQFAAFYLNADVDLNRGTLSLA